MGFVLAGFCVANCWVIPKLWWPSRMLACIAPSTPPRGGGRVLRMSACAPVRPAFGPVASGAHALMLAA
jgi:hypothetical protein